MAGGDFAAEGEGGRPAFQAQSAREGAAVAGMLLREVNFSSFVGGLIQNVFQAIVDASIQQMEAYGELVASVAKTLNQFRDENVSVNQGRDHLVEQFPDFFELSVDTGFFGETGPRVKLRDGADDREAARRVNESLPIEGDPITSLDDETIEERVVPAARTQLATSRQQLLATMVLMGINRIVVTDGRISAKVLYNFRARDNLAYQRSATRFDYDRRLRTVTGEGEFERRSDEGSSSYSSSDTEEGTEISSRNRGAQRWAKGTYKYTSQPALKLASATQENVTGSLETAASLAGNVDINFKSDYFPLEEMADSFQIGRIRDASRPGNAREQVSGTSRQGSERSAEEG
jgi:hypothetical protein